MRNGNHLKAIQSLYRLSVDLCIKNGHPILSPGGGCGCDMAYRALQELVNDESFDNELERRELDAIVACYKR